jgi:antitoxin component YwqK of YwqJK toxin-antitoxin module
VTLADTRGMPEASGAIPHEERYDNGQPKLRGAHLDGAMHGRWEFFRRDGSVMRAGSFDRGRQIGTWRTYDRSGAVVKETDFGDSPT